MLNSPRGRLMRIEAYERHKYWFKKAGAIATAVALPMVKQTTGAIKALWVTVGGAGAAAALDDFIDWGLVGGDDPSKEKK